MKAFLIDPSAKTISLAFHTGHYTDIYKHIKATGFDSVRLTKANEKGTCTVVYVDGEGLLKPNPGPFFLHSAYPDPLCGRGLVLGVDYAGETVEPTTSLEALNAAITFPSLEFAGFTEREYTRGNTFVLERKSNFRRRP